MYLYDDRVPFLISRTIPDAKILIMLRDPAERAYSQYLHLRRNGREKVSDFAVALEREESRVSRGWGPDWHYCRRSRYREQIERYLSAFDESAVYVCLLDDLKERQSELMRGIFAFLGVDDAFQAEAEHRNAGKVSQDGPRRRGPLDRVLKRIASSSSSAGSKAAFGVPDKAIQYIRERTDEDVRWLEEHLDRDLSAWTS